MIKKYLKKNALFPKDLNKVQQIKAKNERFKAAGSCSR